MQKMFFLSGIPRSGSTVLASILNQNNDLYVSRTSPLNDMLNVIQSGWQQYAANLPPNEYQEFQHNIYKSLLSGYYQSINKPYIMDKHRAWPRNIGGLKNIMSDIKVVCTVRGIPEAISSFIKLIEKQPKNNFIDQDLMKRKLSLTTENRAKLLWENYVSDPWGSLRDGLVKNNECCYLVDYDELCNTPEPIIDGIYNFLQIPGYKHNYNKIEDKLQEKDTAWGMLGLHDIRGNLKNIAKTPNEIIGSKLTEYFSQFNFWIPGGK